MFEDLSPNKTTFHKQFVTLLTILIAWNASYGWITAGYTTDQIQHSLIYLVMFTMMGILIAGMINMVGLDGLFEDGPDSFMKKGMILIAIALRSIIVLAAVMFFLQISWKWILVLVLFVPYCAYWTLRHML